MEKFTKFEDPATGINPFLPPKAGKKQKQNTFLSIVGKVLFVIRVPILLIFIILWLILGIIPKILFFPALSHPLQRLFDCIFGRSILILLGFMSVKQQKAVNSIGKPNGYSFGKREDKMDKNSVILTNHVSFIDLICLTTLFSPEYALISNDYKAEIPKKVTVHHFGFLKAVISVMFKTTLENNKGVELSTLLVDREKKRTNSPLVIFMEGTTTNGLTMLQPIRKAFNNSEFKSIFLFTFKYSDESGCVQTTQSLFKFIVKLLSQLSHNLTIYTFLPINNLSAKTNNQDSDEEKQKEDLIEQIRRIICSQINPPSSLTIITKKKFIDYYQEELKKKNKC
ncbi:MAG: hypothetical protein EZS28_013833 [Streblomastix strix]|uniref:Phospholipid/glycerol acyltransferase domain-containing protein n=1 Tax=Streblomastix strix TaxID=222440 RepID=A0A5J4W722_9EUKA|nr:MAG: hypothetical protein EZS28_013833 [Streblomastix strix]